MKLVELLKRGVERTHNPLSRTSHKLVTVIPLITSANKRVVTKSIQIYCHIHNI